MNNDLEQFSEERLKEISNEDTLTNMSFEELLALGRIALAAKQAKSAAFDRTNAFTDEDLEGMAHGNNPVANAYRELLAFRRAAKQVKPVGYFVHTLEDGVRGMTSIPDDSPLVKVATPLYTTPPANSPAIPDGWLAIPATPSQAHLNSIAMRYRHDFYLLNETQKRSALATARQMYEECSGQGYFNIASPKPESE